MVGFGDAEIRPFTSITVRACSLQDCPQQAVLDLLARQLPNILRQLRRLGIPIPGTKRRGLYRDDGLSILKDTSGPAADRLRKKIITNVRTTRLEDYDRGKPESRELPRHHHEPERRHIPPLPEAKLDSYVHQCEVQPPTASAEKRAAWFQPMSLQCFMQRAGI